MADSPEKRRGNVSAFALFVGLIVGAICRKIGIGYTSDILFAVAGLAAGYRLSIREKGMDTGWPFLGAFLALCLIVAVHLVTDKMTEAPLGVHIEQLIVAKDACTTSHIRFLPSLGQMFTSTTIGLGSFPTPVYSDIKDASAYGWTFFDSKLSLDIAKCNRARTDRLVAAALPSLLACAAGLWSTLLGALHSSSS